MPSTNSLKQKAPKRVCMVQRSGPRDLQFRAISRALCSHSGKQETSPSAFWEEAKHLQNYLRVRQTQKSCERSPHPARCKGNALHKGKKADVAFPAFSVCFAHKIPFFHAPGHLGFPCLDNENPAWTLRFFAD